PTCGGRRRPRWCGWRTSQKPPRTPWPKGSASTSGNDPSPPSSERPEAGGWGGDRTSSPTGGGKLKPPPRKGAAPGPAPRSGAGGGGEEGQALQLRREVESLRGGRQGTAGP